MRSLCTLSAVAFLIFIAGCQPKTSETDKQIMKILGEINQKLTSIDKQLKAVKDKNEDKDEDIPLPGTFNNAARGPDFRRLKKIKLPKNPTREQTEKYIEKIVYLSQKQNRFSQSDPQVSMLCKVDSKNVDLLITYANNFYVQYALSRIVTEKDKKKILEALKVYSQLISCVVKNNWIKDAKETIFERLKYSGRGYLSHEWINAAVELASPKEYDILKKYFVYCTNPDMTYRALSQLEDFDMKKAVDEAWKYQKRGTQPWAKKQMAMIAARYGHKDALEYLINVYRIETNQHFKGQIQASLYQLTGKTLSPGKMAKWYKENESKLEFDQENEEYIIKSKAKNKKLKVKASTKRSTGFIDYRGLKKIKLTKNPSRKQIEEYIKKIVDISKKQKSFSSNDPQIAMLSKVGSKNVDLLMKQSKSWHINWAIINVATESNKKQILEAFKKQHQLINCIVKMGWGKDAKITILEYLKKGKVTDYVPYVWSAAAVQAASPKDYDIIEDYFARAGNPEMVFNTLRQLDGLNMKEAANKGWKYQKSKRQTWSKGQMAIIAARFGNKDALKYMVYACRKEKNQYMAAQIRDAIYKLTGKNLSFSKMERWYKKNQAKLVFDPENEEYIIKAK